MRFRQISLTIFCFGAAVSSAAAWPPSPEILQSLERTADAAARIVDTYCGSEDGAFAGAIAGINAMPERAGETPVVAETSGIEGYASAYERLIDSGADYRAIEAAAINGMIHAYDPTGLWRSRADMRYLSRPGSILISIEMDGATPRVTEVDPDGPAARTGILVGDHIVEIDNDATNGAELSLLQSHLEGAIGSEAFIVVDRNGERIEFTMQRVDRLANIVVWRIDSGVAVITLKSFDQNSATRLRDSIRAARHEAPSGYVLDLRGNQGGLLDEVIQSADYLIDGGPIATVRPFSACHSDDVQPYVAHGRDETRGARLVVLIDESTASGAEILAAALKERRSATLVGQHSFGNARIHTVIPMTGGRDGFLKLSTGVISAPSGATWDQTGLTPDIVIEPASGETDPAMARALSLLRRAQ